MQTRRCLKAGGRGEPNERTCAPDLLVVDLLELLREVLAVGAARVELERLARLRAVLHALVELLEHGAVSRLEDRGPVERTATRGRGARVVHVVHAFLTKTPNERNETR